MTPPPGYREALVRLFALTRAGENLGLDGPRALDAALGHPVARVPAILIGGTNGKGSTAAFVEALLRGAGLRVGLFTSPHLISFRERVRIDGEDIAAEAVADGVGRVMAAAAAGGCAPSFFEATWGLAAETFARERLDVAVWEVGLGGRLDATNVCAPRVAAVVTVALDHTRTLGGDLVAIAGEKAAIFRRGRPALTAAEGPALTALERAAPAPIRALGRDFDAELPPELLPLPLAGAHQRRNATLALEIVRTFGVTPDPAHLANVRWPGRGERLDDVVIDCAHNPAGAAALAAWIRETESTAPHLIFGAMADKDVTGVARCLGPVVASIDLVTPIYPRRLEAAALRPAFAGFPVRVAGGVREALAARPVGRTTVVAGSCFLAGEARAALTGQPFPELGLLTAAR